MEDIDKVLDGLYRLRSYLKFMCVGIHGDYYDNSMIYVSEAIHTIRELQELNKGLSETYTSNPMYEIGYKKGASDMEKAKQVIIDKLLEQIPKWHMVADGDFPTDDRDVLCIDISKDYFVGWCFDKSWSDGEFVDIDVIAWMELPKFKGEE